MYNSRKRKMILVGCVSGTALFCLTLIAAMVGDVVKKQTSNSPKQLVIELPELNRSSVFQSVPGSYIMSEEEFEEFKAQEGAQQFESYEDYVVNASKADNTNAVASFEIKKEIPNTVSNKSIITAEGANEKLFAYCDEYFNCYFSNQRISPIFPMALANVETPGRADNTVTWSALFPSAIVSTDLIDTFSVVDIVEDPVTYHALTVDYSTRDRGPLQMSPTYGTNNEQVTLAMSGSEVSKLEGVDTRGCAGWVSGCSSYPGDRFYLPDMLLRLQIAMNQNCYSIASNGYIPETEAELIAQLAVSHNSGCGIWMQRNPEYGAGNWPSAQKCYELCKMIGSDEFVQILYDYAMSTDRTYIDRNTGFLLWQKYSDESLANYCNSSINAAFPILCLYSYIKLSLLYTE